MPYRRSLLALAFAAALVGIVLLALIGPSSETDGPTDVERPHAETVEPPQLRGHPDAAAAALDAQRGDGAVEGLVLDEAGRPIAGVPVRIRREWEPYRRNVLALPVPGAGVRAPPFVGAAISDAEGRFRIDGLEEDVRTWVWALPTPPHASARALATPQADRVVHVVLHLQRGAPLRGRVIDVDGRGVPAWIDAMLPFRNEHRARGTGDWCVRGLATDAEGRFVLDAVPDGLVWLSAFAPGVGDRTHTPIRTPAKEEVLVRLGVVPGATLEGHVRDVEGRPVSGASLYARVTGRLLGFGHQEMWGRVERSKADGAYRIPNLLPGRVQDVRVEADGFIPSRFMGHGIELQQGEVVPFDVVLVRGCAVEGRVVADQGGPIAGAEIRVLAFVSPGVPASSAGVVPTPTDAQGRYRVADLYAGRRTIHVTHRRYRQAERLVVELEAGLVLNAPDIEMVELLRGSEVGAGDASETPAPTGAIEGRLLAPDGTPVPGLEVRAASPASAGTTVIAGTRGFFRIDAAAPGTWHLHARDTRGNTVGEEVLVEVRADEVTRGVEVRTFPPRYLSGVVVDEQGHPVGGLSMGVKEVGAGSPWPPGVGTYTDLDGTFGITVYADAEWAFTLRAKPCPGVYRSGARGIRLVYEPRQRRRLVVVVLGPSGDPLLNAHVKVSWTDGGRTGTTCRAGGGRYYCEIPAEVRAVDIRVESARDPLGRPLDVAPLELTGVAVGEDPIEVQLETGRKVQVTVSDPDGRPVAGAAVRVRTIDTGTFFEEPASQRTDDRGLCVVAGLPADEDLVVIVTSTGPHANPPPVLVQRGTHRIDVQLSRATVVLGQVLNAAGGPLVGGTVIARLTRASRERWQPTPIRLAEPPYGNWRLQTDEQGRFRIERVPAGAVLHVRAEGREDELPAWDPEVAAGTTNLVLQLSKGALIQGRCTGMEVWPYGGFRRLELRRDGEAHAGHAPRVASAQIAPDGSFQLGPVPAGRYRLVLRVRALTLIDVPVDAPAEEVELALPAPHRLEVRVAGGEGFDVAVVTAEPPTSTSSTLDPSGVKVFTFLDDQPRKVVVNREGDERVGVVDGARPSHGPVRVTLEPGLSIGGRIAGAPPAKVAGFDVMVSGNAIHRSTKPAADGSFRVIGLVPGTYRVHCYPMGAPGRITQLEDVSAGREDLVLRFEPR